MTATARSGRTATLSAILVAAFVLWAPHAVGQTPEAASRWQAWVGCWEPVADADAVPVHTAAEDAIVCVLPALAGSGFETVSIVDGVVVERQALDASGTRRAVERDSCTGWESMEWSRDGRRVFQRSEYECGGFQRGSSGVLTILPSGEWLTVQAITAGEYASVGVLRYRAIPADRATPEVAGALAGRGFAMEAARMAAAARPTIDEVVEATRVIDAPVVEAWLIEQGQGFQIDAARLIALADAGVPDRVIDLMVALSYPTVFAIDRSAREGEIRPDERGAAPPAPRPGVFGMNPWMYPGYGMGSYYFGMDPYFSGGGYYPGRGYYPGYRGSYYPPAIIIVRENEERTEPGRMVRGQGYTQGASGSGFAPPASTSGTTRPAPSATPAPSSGGSGDSGGSGRTAQPRGGGTE